ncbi:MAG: hypothetical protein K6G23_11165, partial [Lachnospiraceae bacterium]|nr:hypothetical protein [Lachnospiraceae bacterium]
MNKEPFSRQQLFVRVLLVITLILLSVLGFFCHATGDDYVLSFLAHRAYERGDHLFGILAAAAEGTSLEYYRWQGTYT